MRKLSPSSASSEWRDLIAFLAALATGIVLVTLGHMTAGGLAAACTALVGLYRAYKYFHPIRDGRRSSDGADVPVGKDEDSALPPSS